MAIFGVDTGGTFTDFVLFDGKELKIHKVISTPSNPAGAIFKGLKELGIVSVRNQASIVHGTTVATNTFLERKGAKVLLVTTKGFEDVIEIGRQNRSKLYDLFIERESALVEKKLRLGVSERVSSEGDVVLAIRESDIRQIKDKLKKGKLNSIALCLLFSYKNPSNEKSLFSALQSIGVHISASHQILPEYREYERFIATVTNAYVSPVLAKYIVALQDGLEEIGVGNVRIMQSNGGSISVQSAKDRGVHCILSGPAGGVVGAYKIACNAGHKKIISFDMGGTSTDVSVCDGKVNLSSTAFIGDTPIKIPVIDIHTVGAGGGSIAKVDSGGALCVGPQSAGADPGPVCYGKGDELTVTDANLFLGRISAERFLGGKMPLYLEKVCLCFDRLAEELNMSPVNVAEGIINVANSNMERAIKVISVERGYDVRDFTLVSFGGSGGLHACDLAAGLSIGKVMVPEHAGVLSALGMAYTDLVKDYSRSLLMGVKDGDFDKLVSLAEPLCIKAKNEIVDEGISASKIRTYVTLDMRYVGQSFELNLPLTKSFVEKFHKLHDKTFESADRGYEVEVVNIRVRVVGKTIKPPLKKKLKLKSRLGDAVVEKSKSFYGDRWIDVDVYERCLIPICTCIKNPALIVEDTATTFLPQGHVCEIDEYGNLVMERV